MSSADPNGEYAGTSPPAMSPKSQAFTRDARLNQPSEFKAVFRKPLVSADACFKILARANNGPVCRLGLAVSRQVDRKATGRNRIKRVVRESFRRKMMKSSPVALDIVVLPRRECDTISNDQLFESLHSHWRRLKSKAEAAAADKGSK